MITNLTYKKSGVDYHKIDNLKLLSQKEAKKTAHNFAETGWSELEISRGESAYVVDCGRFYLASITECLGTKVLVADQMGEITGKTYYGQIAQDTIAMAVNDILTVGARPISIHAYWALGDSKWLENKKRMTALIRGWKKACDLSGAAWGGGETPVLGGVVGSQTIDLAASCVGLIKPKTRLTLGKKLRAGDAIILFASSGIHANGLTLARKIAEHLPQGYTTKLPDGTLYGEALLKTTLIYNAVIQNLFKHKVNIHYISNITGHGWRKIMRHSQKFTYQINAIPPVPPVLNFMVKHGPLSLKEAYGSLNMGAGFVVFVSQKDASKTIAVAKKNGIKAYKVGWVEKGPKQVIIKPLNIIYQESSLKLRN